jgi:16S rRNA (adenine1518-N6/adenine1519-N6)-dimethyltransferase
MPDLFKETRDVLRQLNIHPEKRRGQNFMIEEKELLSITDALKIKNGEELLEIGPGLGFLTRALLDAGAKVTAIENDYKLLAYLNGAFKGREVTFIEKDILEFEPSILNLKWPVQAVGNIPYNITSPIIEWLIRQKKFIRSAILTVQWEVAERLTAVPGKKVWGPLSIFAQTNARVSLVKKIQANSFYPSPKVDSAVIRLEFDQRPELAIKDEAVYFKVVRTSFQKRRKTLLNSLLLASENHSKEALLEAFKSIPLDPIRRPETLTLQEWAELSNRISSISA